MQKFLRKRMNNLTAKFKNCIKNSGSKKYLVGGVAVALLVVFACTLSLFTSYAVVIDGKVMGEVSSASALDQAMAAAKEKAQQESGMEIVDSYNTVETKTHLGKLNDKLNSDELETLLDNEVDWLVKGAVVNINNGDAKFAVANEKEGKAVISKLKDKATENAGEDAVVKEIEFKEPVEVEAGNVRVSQLQSPEKIIEKIGEGKEELKTHEVKEGESFWTIAINNGLSVEELQKINPNVKPEKLMIGDEVSLTKQEPLIHVLVTKEITVEEAIAHETEYKDTKKLLKGQSKVVTEGEDGKKSVTYEIKTANGATVERNVVNEVVVSAPVTEVVNKGTGVKLSSRSDGPAARPGKKPSGGSYNGGNGSLSWPMHGRITSPYGPRSRGFHSGIDIGTPVGTPIHAATSGKVVMAGWYGGYGNCLVIDHGNGMKTRYAHLSGFNCRVGDSVSRGQVVARSGNTGRSTGPHLHFEVIVNGSTRNPMNYLR